MKKKPTVDRADRIREQETERSRSLAFAAKTQPECETILVGYLARVVLVGLKILRRYGHGAITGSTIVTKKITWNFLSVFRDFIILIAPSIFDKDLNETFVRLGWSSLINSGKDWTKNCDQEIFTIFYEYLRTVIYLHIVEKKSGTTNDRNFKLLKRQKKWGKW